jgi:RNA polymerase sigma-70 factor, ECF subfamily
MGELSICKDMDAKLSLLGDTTVQDELYVVPDFDGFDELYRREYPGLHAVASALVSVDKCEDMVQDTMFRALLNWKRVRRLDRPGAWCHRVLVNACRMLWRRRLVERRYLSRYPYQDFTTSGPSPDIVAFWTAVRELPSRPRLAVALYYAADYTTVEIASILGVPEGTVRSDLARARTALVAQLRGSE